MAARSPEDTCQSQAKAFPDFALAVGSESWSARLTTCVERMRTALATEPTLVGVTGHRTVDEASPALGAAIETVLDRVADRGPGLVALSPLAEGADRMVARRVLARPGGRLRVLLPLAADDYERDFENPASRADFRVLLARAESVLELPAADTRDDAYLAAGRAVVDGCDLLVALWDGEPARGRGGTAEVVAYARASGRPLAWIDVGSGEVTEERWSAFERSR